MTDDGDDFHALAAVVEAIENSIGDVEDVSVEYAEKSSDGPAFFRSVLFGSTAEEPVFEVRFRVDDEFVAPFSAGIGREVDEGEDGVDEGATSGHEAENGVSIPFEGERSETTDEDEDDDVAAENGPDDAENDSAEAGGEGEDTGPTLFHTTPDDEDAEGEDGDRGHE